MATPAVIIATGADARGTHAGEAPVKTGRSSFRTYGGRGKLTVRVRGEVRAEIVLRATYVLVHSASGWQVVQQHVSAPVEEGYFGDLLFGDPGELARD
jgi:hypothetical protein